MGLEAFNAIKKKNYDVVLMDVQMPVMGGFEATEKIRQWEKKSNPIDSLSFRTPIIALTAHAMLGDREKSLAKGMDDYVSKPLKPKLLMQTINKCIHNINQLKELSKQNNNNRTSDFAKNLKKGSIKSSEQSATNLLSIGSSSSSNNTPISNFGNSANGSSCSTPPIDNPASPRIRKANSNDVISNRRPGQLDMSNRSLTESVIPIIGGRKVNNLGEDAMEVD